MPFYSSSRLNYKRQPNFRNPIKANIPASDPFFNNVVLLLRNDGANAGTTFSDSSPLNLSVTRQGTNPPTTSTTRAKYGSASALFSATNSWLSVNHPDLALGTGAFTIEFWAWLASASSSGAGVYAFGNSATDLTDYGGVVFPAAYYSYQPTNTGVAFPFSQWNHVALVREGIGTNQTKTYLNGNLINSRTLSTNLTKSFVNIGAYNTSAPYSLGGWLDSFRITKGVARYTAAFDPETAANMSY